MEKVTGVSVAGGKYVYVGGQVRSSGPVLVFWKQSVCGVFGRREHMTVPQLLQDILAGGQGDVYLLQRARSFRRARLINLPL